MPRNKFGGKNAKKLANKKVEVAGSRQFIVPDEDSRVGIVTKRCGDGRFRIDYMDDEGTLQTGVGRVPGSSRRMTRNIRDGDFVLFQQWGLSANDEKGSILHLYTENDIPLLKEQGYLKGLVADEEGEGKGVFTSLLVDDGGDDDGGLDIDAL